MAFKAITTLEQLEALDTNLCVSGYRAGLDQQPDYTQRDQAYWHGYLNGCVDGGHMQASAEQRQLAAACIADPARSPFAALIRRQA